MTILVLTVIIVILILIVVIIVIVIRQEVSIHNPGDVTTLWKQSQIQQNTNRKNVNTKLSPPPFPKKYCKWLMEPDKTCQGMGPL